MNLAQKVELIRRELALEPSMPMAAAIRAANDAMGLAAAGSQLTRALTSVRYSSVLRLCAQNAVFVFSTSTGSTVSNS